MPEAGFVIIAATCSSRAVMKTSVDHAGVPPSATSRTRRDPGVFEGRAIVFEGPEDYHHGSTTRSLEIDEDCFLFIRHRGPVGYPGAAEVVNMLPPDRRW